MLKIRLRRVGGTNAPAYRVVVSDSRRTPTAPDWKPTWRNGWGRG